ncbi:hypothetical protein C8R45DRAFT_234318 [Mycena sanguinolenta]|nr:hypothetical protein C8R45DRAFT_234318 [Mycena sanguinolenta]
MFESSPSAASLPPLALFNCASKDIPSGTSSFDCDASAALPLPVNRVRHFDATIVPPRNTGPADLVWRSKCPGWSGWGTAQFTFDYLFALITGSTSSDLWKEEHYEHYIDTIYKLYVMIEIIGRMPDGSLPPSVFQGFYHLKRLFPKGLVAPRDVTIEVGTALLLRVFALGIAVANQAIFQQRNLNLDWEYFCGIPNSDVDDLEVYALQVLNGDVFDLEDNRSVYLNWLGHLGYYAEFRYSLSGHTYLRSTADLLAFARAKAFLLPERQRDHIHPIRYQCVWSLTVGLCWGTEVTPLPPKTIQLNAEFPSHIPRSRSRSLRPTAEDVLAAVDEEYTQRLFYPLSVASPGARTHFL